MRTRYSNDPTCLFSDDFSSVNTLLTQGFFQSGTTTTINVKDAIPFTNFGTGKNVAYFDGQSSLQCRGMPSLRAADWTIAFKFRDFGSPNSDGGQTPRIFQNSNIAGEPRVIILLSPLGSGSRPIRLRISDGTNTIDSSGVTTPIDYANRKEHSIVVTRSGTTFNLYVDNVLTINATSTMGSIDNGNIWSFGGLGGVARIIGTLRDFCVFNRAWDAQEILEYSNETTFDYMDTEIARWDFSKAGLTTGIPNLNPKLGSLLDLKFGRSDGGFTINNITFVDGHTSNFRALRNSASGMYLPNTNAKLGTPACWTIVDIGRMMDMTNSNHRFFSKTSNADLVGIQGFRVRNSFNGVPPAIIFEAVPTSPSPIVSAQGPSTTTDTFAYQNRVYNSVMVASCSITNVTRFGVNGKLYRNTTNSVVWGTGELCFNCDNDTITSLFGTAVDQSLAFMFLKPLTQIQYNDLLARFK